VCARACKCDLNCIYGLIYHRTVFQIIVDEFFSTHTRIDSITRTQSCHVAHRISHVSSRTSVVRVHSTGLALIIADRILVFALGALGAIAVEGVETFCQKKTVRKNMKNDCPDMYIILPHIYRARA